LVAAAQLGQHQALQARVAALTQERDHLGTSLTALTHKVAELETQLRETAAARADSASQFTQAAERLELALTSATASLGKPTMPREALMEEVLNQVKRLTAAVTRPTPRKRTSRAPAPSRSARRRPFRRHPHAAATSKGKRLPTSSSRKRRTPSRRRKR
jgi:chromosome segregation ATPase